LTRLVVVPLTHLPFSAHTVATGSSEPAEYCQEGEIFPEAHHLPYNARGRKTIERYKENL
jgi:hypothetical protein